MNEGELRESDLIQAGSKCQMSSPLWSCNSEVESNKSNA